MHRFVQPLRRYPHLTRSPAFLLLLAAALAVFLWRSPSKAPAAPNTSALIAEALDHQFEMELNDALPEALDKIGSKTGVTIKADPVIWDLLPWGEQTTLTAKFKNVTLRQALTAITRKYGLIFSLGDEAVILKPMPALRRLGRRATVQELDGLAALAATEMPKVPNAPTVRGMLAVVDSRLESMPPYAIEDRLPNDLRDKPLDVPRNATLLEAMELLVKQTPASWYPWGKYLVVVPKPTLIRDHLGKTFTVKYSNTDILQVLEDLRRQAAVDFIIEPGAIQRVPAEFRNVRVYWENVTVEQALESLKGLTGLQYTVTDDGIKITNALPANTGAAGAAGVNTDPAVALLALDNGIQVMLRRSDVPPDVQAYLKHRAGREVENLRKMMKQEGFHPDPATLTPQPSVQPQPAAPATQPAPPPAPPPAAPPPGTTTPGPVNGGAAKL